jgi:hypothetical protein
MHVHGPLTIADYLTMVTYLAMVGLLTMANLCNNMNNSGFGYDN